MSNFTRKSELALALCFLGIIFAVPITQTWVEIRRGERVQFADVLRYKPTAKNLREYEAALKDKSVFQQQFRPVMQRLLFTSLHDTGAKAVLGLDQWYFYRPDLRYLVEADHLETDDANSKWVRPSAAATRRESVTQAIVRFRDQLKERGIVLLVVPVPGKPSIYPDKLTRRAAGQELRSPTQDLLEQLRQRGIETVDLFAAFNEARRRSPGGAANLYLARDTHWTPRAAELAAGKVSEKLRERSWSPAADREFVITTNKVNRWGDVIEMMQIPGLPREFSPELIECRQVQDPDAGLLVPTASDRPGVFKYPAQKSSILVLGDSFCRIYQFPEPQSLGELAGHPANDHKDQKLEQGTKRLLPGSAGFISHLALNLKAPVDAIVSDGGASTDVRCKLSTNPEILENKKVVIWEFVERDIALGAQGWEDVPLPVKLE